ncbi:FYVE-domain-containing protein [Lichtheimia hyalospora FSU 10163]|nr:FYVE-domain-containing protein [Lichtheimia hyalospora FSU 10163]
MQLQDDRQTFLLPRPVWINDIDVTQCTLCNSPFNAIRRRHHCRHCGNIFCQECSSKSVPLPQLGYGSRPVRVCNGCFEVAYLVTYAIDDDHGLSTQIHGARGLLELIERDNEKDIHNIIAYGGIDALIWLCRTSSSIQLHHLTTTILAILAEKESVRPVIITKWALPPLLHLVEHYIYYDTKDTKKHRSSPSSIHSKNGYQDNETHEHNEDEENTMIQQQEVVLEIVINCAHVLYQLARAGILSQTNIVDDGIFFTLLTLAAYEPTTTTPSMQQDTHSEASKIIQSLAAKAISAISGQVTHQPAIIELVRGSDKFASLIQSTNDDVRKYLAKSIAYLSLRNDKYKPALLAGDVARALVSVIALLPQQDNSKQRKQDLSYYLSRSMDGKDDMQKYTPMNPSAVSHICCALANFATNQESQTKLMSQPRLLKYICNVPSTFPEHAEVHRHVARCLANFALYEENNGLMLAYTTQDDLKDNAYDVLPTLLAMGQNDAVTADIQRHIVRAIDNLSAFVSDEREDKPNWDGIFSDAYSFILRVLVDSKDADTLKRARSIKEKASRAGITGEQQQQSSESTSSIINKPAPAAATTSDGGNTSTTGKSKKSKKKKGKHDGHQNNNAASSKQGVE